MNPDIVALVCGLALACALVGFILGILYWESKQMNHNANAVKEVSQEGGHFWLNPAGDQHAD